MKYLAVNLCPYGGVVRDEETLQALNEDSGDFSSTAEATDYACQLLNCEEVRNGIISRGRGKGGYIVVTIQEFVEF